LFAIRTYWPRINTLQQFPSISVERTFSRPFPAYSHIKFQSSQSRSEVSRRDVFHHLSQRQCLKLILIIPDYRPHTTASHNFPYRDTERIFCRVRRRASILRPGRDSGHLCMRVHNCFTNDTDVIQRPGTKQGSRALSCSRVLPPEVLLHC